VIDSWLPEMDGVALCEHIRKSDKTTPIVFFSGVAHKAEQERARAAGANEFLIKPINSENFVSAIEKLSGCAEKAEAA
jgi:CheY-like chemotaxis protein